MGRAFKVIILTQVILTRGAIKLLKIMYKIVVDTPTFGKDTLIKKFDDYEKAIAYKYFLEELIRKYDLECSGEVRVLGGRKRN